MAWPTNWDRGFVLGAIEDASGVALHATDPLPDTLTSAAQALGLQPVELRMWIYDSPEHPWTPQDLDRWARRRKFGIYAVDAEGDTTDEIPRRDDGVQEATR